MRLGTLLKRAAVMTVVAGSMVAIMPATAGANNIGNEGCTPGYWKNHHEAWEEYTPSSTLGGSFTFPSNLSQFADDTFAEALEYKGGSGLDGATRILMRAATAAFLNAAHEGLGYPYRRFDSPGDLQESVNAALASGDRQQILDYAKVLDDANNLGCPL